MKPNGSLVVTLVMIMQVLLLLLETDLALAIVHSAYNCPQLLMVLTSLLCCMFCWMKLLAQPMAVTGLVDPTPPPAASQAAAWQALTSW